MSPSFELFVEPALEREGLLEPDVDTAQFELYHSCVEK